ncbi:MAG: cyclic nucleotide-binding domain-containing protein [Geminicoccaceae bacterium]
MSASANIAAMPSSVSGAGAARDAIAEALAGGVFFDGIGIDNLRPLAEQAAVKTMRAGDLIFSAGDHSDALFAVVGGRVQIDRELSDGGVAVIGQIEAGEVFGEIAVIDGGRRSASARCLEDGQLGVINAEIFMHYLDTHPGVTVRLLRMMAHRQRGTIEQVDALAFAYRELEARSKELEQHSQQGGRSRRRALLALITTISLLYFGHWWWVDRGPGFDLAAFVPGMAAPNEDGPAGQPAVSLDVVSVQSQPVELTIGLIGKIGPGEIYDITAPFDATVNALNFDFGARVDRGDELVALDTSELEKKLRTAEIERIEAENALDDLRNWENSSEVAEARRSLASAQERLATSQSQLDGTTALYNAGVLSREEYEQAQNAVAEAQRSVAAARDSFDATMRKGSEENIHVATLKLQNATVEYDKTAQQLAEAVIRSPATGVALKPPEATGSNNSGANQQVALGTSVSARQLLLSIGDMESLTIEALVSELDIDDIRPGLKVDVTSEVLGADRLSGEIETAASQAIGSGREGSLAQYPVTVRLKDVPEAQREKLRLGMSAQLRVITYSNPNALLIPQSAVIGSQGAFQVLRYDPSSGQVTPQPITVGRSLPQGLEVQAGLAEGDRILRQPQSYQGAPS